VLLQGASIKTSLSPATAFSFFVAGDRAGELVELDQAADQVGVKSAAQQALYR